MSNSANPEPIAGIVCGHGNFAEGLISAVQQITGRGGIFFGISNFEYSGEQLEERIRSELARTGASVVFTDLPGGSGTFAVRKIIRNTPGVVLVTGTNLGVLLDFVFHVDEGAAQAARQAAERGRACITVAEAP